MGQSIGEADSPSDMTSCPFCCKDFSKNANLNKHLGKCKLLPASCRTLRRNSSQSDIKVYQVDKSLDLYVNTCDNDYAKFMCCENDQYPICIPGFWPCLFDYRGSEGLEEIRDLVCSHKSYDVLSSILLAAYHYYNVRSISFSVKSFVKNDGQIYNISKYRVPKYWQNSVLKKRPTFLIVVSEGTVKVSFTEKFLEKLCNPMYLEEVIPSYQSEALCEDSSDDSVVQELSQTLSQVSLESECDGERPSKRARFENCETVSDIFTPAEDGHASQMLTTAVTIEPLLPVELQPSPPVTVQPLPPIRRRTRSMCNIEDFSDLRIESSISVASSDSALASINVQPRWAIEGDQDSEYIVCLLCKEPLKSGRGQLERHQRNYCAARQGIGINERRRRRSTLIFFYKKV